MPTLKLRSYKPSKECRLAHQRRQQQDTDNHDRTEHDRSGHDQSRFETSTHVYLQVTNEY